MQQNIDTVISQHPVQRQLQPLGVQQDDPVARGFGTMRAPVHTDGAHRIQDKRACTADRLDRLSALLKEPAIRQHLRRRCRPTEKAVLFNQADLGPCTCRTKGRADATCPATGDDDIIFAFDLAAHARHPSRRFSISPTRADSMTPSSDRMVTPANRRSRS